ncbi:hypothetical protein [Companilactobacillus insicii]|uniref:hypothetical protein n=1 Tax=Companilactobacillus insicii TaxID=1732567 RepID=UPI000F7791C2|nr:hypothetical protein [Companilactobacillus insicii]
MKDKKDLRGSKDYMLIGAAAVGIITAVIFFIMLSRGVVNAVVTSKISSQYQDKELEVLKTDLDYHSLNTIGKLIDVSDGYVVSSDNVKKYNQLEAYVNARKQRSADISKLYDGKEDYQDDVTKDKIDNLDKKLLNEKNQDVYQKLRNKLDTIQIWYEQTQDADKYISKVWDAFNEDNASLSFKKVSMSNTYYKLIKNKAVKKQWSEAVSKMRDYYASHQGESTQVAAAKQELEELRNSPLTEKYTPAQVDIVSSLDFSSDAEDALTAAGLTGKYVLYYDSNSNNLALMTKISGKYVAQDGYISVSNSQVSKGKYTIKRIVSAGSSDAIITDSSNSSFGQYVSSASSDDLSNLGVTNADNTTADFNSATPVFWFKNNSALTSSIYFGSGSTIGFIYAGGSSYNNGMQISSSDLSSLKSEVSSGITFYVN